MSLPALTEPSVQRLLAARRAARKRGDVLAYAANYAPQFGGLTATEAGVTRLDPRAFLNLAALQARDPEQGATAHIALGSTGARVTFDAKPHAPAPDELFVTATSSGPRIAWQAPARSAGDGPVAAGLWLADDHGVLLSAAVDAAWATGPTNQVGNGTATRAVATEKLPKPLSALLGRSLRGLGANGAVCEVRLQRFAIRAEITPDPRTAELWEGCSDEHSPEASVIARDVWQLAGASGRVLVGEFSSPCRGALLAEPSDAPAPALALPEPASAEWGAAAMEAFRRLPEYARVQARFTRDFAGTRSWDDVDARRGVWSWRLGQHAAQIFVSVEAGAGCSGFSASLSALWEVRGSEPAPRLVLLTVPPSEDDRRLVPRAALDLDGSGAVLLGPDGSYRARSLLTPTKGGYERRLLVSTPFFGGPC